MKNLLLIAVMIGFFIGCSKTIEQVNIIKVQPKSKISNMILKIPINFQDKGYKNIETKLISNREEFNNFLKSIKKQKGWNKRENFIEVLKESKIDFSSDNFLIYTFQESSSKVVIAVDAPISDGNNIVIKIGKESNKKVKKDKIVYYALAYKVKKSADTIIFNNGQEKITIDNGHKDKKDKEDR